MQEIIVPEPVDLALPLETIMQRRQTDAFIAADPWSLALLRPIRLATASGGWQDVVPPEPNVPDQVFRLIPTNDRTPEVRDSNGRKRVPTYTLLGSWDADLATFDRFQMLDVWYECIDVRPHHTQRRYYSKADIVIWEM